MRITLDLDRTTTERLAVSSARELRPVTLQAQVILMRALGVPFPGGDGTDRVTNRAAEEVAA